MDRPSAALRTSPGDPPGPRAAPRNAGAQVRGGRPNSKKFDRVPVWAQKVGRSLYGETAQFDISHTKVARLTGCALTKSQPRATSERKGSGEYM